MSDAIISHDSLPPQQCSPADLSLPQQTYSNPQNGEPKSWGDALRQYQQQKVSHPQDVAPVYRHTRDKSSIWRSEQGCYNPILQQFRDSTKELQTCEKERQLRDSNKKEFPYHQRDFDIINLEAKRPSLKKPDSGETKKPNEESFASVRRSDLCYQRRFQRANDECPFDLDSQFGKRKKLSKMREKTNFNIVNYAPASPDALPIEAEIEKKDSTIQKKYDHYKKSHFDPVLQQFYDKQSDETYLTHMTQKQLTKRELYNSRLPNHVKENVTNHYDMITMRVHKPEKLEQIDKEPDVLMMKQLLKGQAEHDIMEKRIRKSECNDFRNANRFKYGPFIEFKHQGRLYDIVSGRSYVGQDAEPTKSFVRLKEMAETQPKYIWDVIAQKDATKMPDSTSRSIFEMSANMAKKELKLRTIHPQMKPLLRSSGFQNMNIFK